MEWTFTAFTNQTLSVQLIRHAKVARQGVKLANHVSAVTLHVKQRVKRYVKIVAKPHANQVANLLARVVIIV